MSDVAEQEIAEQNGTPGGSSLLDGIRQKHREVRNEQDDRLRLNVPGFGGELRAVYHRAEWDGEHGVGPMVLRVSAGAFDGTVQTNDAIDLMIRSCEQIEIKIGEDYVPLHEAAPADFGTEPVRYDERLASAAGISQEEVAGPDGRPRGRSVVRAVIPREALLTTHAAQLAAWYVREGDEAELGF